jgi:hypothetical protein
MRQKKKYLDVMTRDVHTLKDIERSNENERRLEEQVSKNNSLYDLDKAVE